MFTYSYNLRSLGFEESEYSKIATRAQRLARQASAVDTGRFRKGWVTIIQGDILLVQNAVRYAPFVELGSAVYTFHRYRIRRALESLGLTRGSEKFGTAPTQEFSEEQGASVRGESPGAVPSDSDITIVVPVQPLTEQEIRSPALLLNRFKTPRAQPTALPTVQQIPKAQLFNRSRLLELIIAAEIVNEQTNNEE